MAQTRSSRPKMRPKETACPSGSDAYEGLAGSLSQSNTTVDLSPDGPRRRPADADRCRLWMNAVNDAQKEGLCQILLEPVTVRVHEADVRENTKNPPQE